MPNLAETINIMRRLARLEEGWSYGEGCAFSPQTIQAAEALAMKAAELGFESIDAFPGLSGEIQITLYAAPYYYELTVEPNPGIILWQEHNQAETFYAEYSSSLEAMKQLAQAPNLAQLHTPCSIRPKTAST